MKPLFRRPGTCGAKHAWLKALALLAALAVFAVLGASGRALAVTYTTEEVAIVNQMNDYRAGLGLQRLMVSDLISDAAEKHSSDMGTYSFFSHTTQESDWFPVGADAHVRMARCGYSFQVAWGENIAGDYSTAAGVFGAWKASGDHNRIMTDPAYRVVGVGLVYISGSPYGYYWTVDFGAYVDQTAHWVGSDIPAPSPTTTPTTTTPTTTTPTTTTPTTTTPPSTTPTTTPPPSPPTTQQGPQFADVPPGHPFYQEITALAQAGILSGSGDGLFHPDSLITRAQFAKIIVLALGRQPSLVDRAKTPTFADVPFRDSGYPFAYVEDVAELGIMLGYEDGTFRPQLPVTRVQLALILARAGGAGLASPPAGYTCPFPDVPAYAREAVARVYFNGLVSGKTATVFDAYAPATRGQVAKMVFRFRSALGF